MRATTPLSPDVSIVVPTYNERGNLEPLLRRICAALPDRSIELLVVDDDSPDGTAAEAERLAAEAARGPAGAARCELRCIVRRGERGLATAVIRGLREARGELLVVMDADLSHPPEKIPELLGAMRDPAVSMAVGSRFVPGASVDLVWPVHRRLNSLAGRLLARPLTGVRDMMSGFFCVRKVGLRLDHLRPIGYKIALELIVRNRWSRVVEIPISFAERAAGTTKLSIREQWRYLRHLARLYGFVLSRRR